MPTRAEAFRRWIQYLEICAFSVAQNFNPDLDHETFMRDLFPEILSVCQGARIGVRTTMAA